MIFVCHSGTDRFSFPPLPLLFRSLLSIIGVSMKKLKSNRNLSEIFYRVRGIFCWVKYGMECEGG